MSTELQKLMNPTRLWSLSPSNPVRVAELAMLARCEDCHAKKTRSEMEKHVCSRGHDKRITGRDNGGRCSECRREDDRLARAEGRKK